MRAADSRGSRSRVDYRGVGARAPVENAVREATVYFVARDTPLTDRALWQGWSVQKPGGLRKRPVDSFHVPDRQVTISYSGSAEMPGPQQLSTWLSPTDAASY